MNLPSAPRSTRSIAAETLMVLLVCVVPNVFNSMAWAYFTHAPAPFLYQSLSGIVRSVGSIALIAFVINRSDEPLANFGLKRPSVFRDGLGGIGVFILGLLAYYLTWYGLAVALGPG